MKKILHIILISCFCITVISCAREDDSSSSIYSSSDADETRSSLLTEADTLQVKSLFLVLQPD